MCLLAVGEGAIEGSAKDYEISATDTFSAAFKYSRWNLIEAPPRNISQLTGFKRRAAGDGKHLRMRVEL